MSFNRLKYDSCEYKKYSEESSGPGKYYYSAPIINEISLNDNPRVINQKGGVSLNSHVDWRFYSGPVDVESDLFNINRSGSLCPNKKYLPNCDQEDCTNQGEICGGGVMESCQQKNGEKLRNRWNRPGDNNLVNFPKSHFPTEDTRLSNPAENLRGTGWNRFDPLCKDPQHNIFFAGESMTPTRIIFKDNHRPSVVPPKINDMNPNEEMQQMPKISNGVSANPIRPLYQYDVCG